MYFLPKLALHKYTMQDNSVFYTYSLFLVSPLPYVDIIIEVVHNSSYRFGGIFDNSLYYMIFAPGLSEYNLFYQESEV